MRTNREIIRKNRLGRLVGPATLAFGLLVGSYASAFTFETGAATLNGDDATFFRYFNTVNMPNDTNVTISLPQLDTSILTPAKLAAFNDGFFQVRVTVSTIISGANVQMDNDSEDAQTGTARVQNLVNSFTSPLLIDQANNIFIQASTLQLNESQNFLLGPTSGDTIGEFNVTNQGDFASWSPGVLTASGSGILNTGFTTPFIGSGNVSFAINSTYTTSATFSGELGFFQGNTPTGQFFAEVEYIVIPEPGTIALFAIALGSAGGMAFLRRRKRS